MASYRPTGLRRSGDQSLDRLREDVERALRELRASRPLAGRLIADVELADGQTVHVAHGLGRPAMVFLSAPRASDSATTGRIRDVTAAVQALNQVDPYRAICLEANGWGETIYVNVWVM